MKCGSCGSTNGYVRIRTDEFVCRKCGTVTPVGAELEEIRERKRKGGKDVGKAGGS